MPANLDNSAVATGLEKVNPHPNSQEGLWFELKNVQTTRKLHASPMLVRLCSKSCMLGFSITSTENFQMFKLDLVKAEEPEIKLPTSTGSSKNQESSRKIPTSALLTTTKLTVWITTNCGKFLDGNPTPSCLLPDKSV